MDRVARYKRLPEMVLPLVDSSSLITQCHRHCSDFAEIKVVAIVVVVRGYPSNPHTGRVLTSEDPH